VTRKLPAAILILGISVVVILVLYLVTSPSGPQKTLEQRRVNLFAVVESISVDEGWTQNNGATTGTIRLTLDDGRTLTLPERTLVDDYSVVPACSDLATPKSCVLIADMLGQSVVWFALVPVDTRDGDTVLTLPGLVDMQNNGDEGVLANGWVIRLAAPVTRECSAVSTTSLRDFINRYPGTASESFVDLTADEISRVRCNNS
jgi:hypothetical protein